MFKFGLFLSVLTLVGCTSDEPTPSPERAPATETPMTPSPPNDSSPTAETPVQTPAVTSEPAPVPGDAWERLADAPLALTEVAGIAHDGRMWIAGGYAPDGSPSPAVLVYDPADQAWTDGPALPTGVHHAVLVSSGTELLLLGGFLGPGFDRPTDEVWVLDASARSWQPGPALPEPRGAGAAAWDGHRFVFAGGVGSGGVAADAYALVDGDWERFGALAEPRQHLAAASDGDGRTWIMGGRHSSLETNLGTVEVISGSSVERLTAELTPRSGVGAFWIGSVGACLVGGEAPGGTLPEVECVTDEGDLVTMPPLTVARHGLGVALLEDGVYAAAGGEQPGLFVSPVLERLPLD
jgi:hypothetical protein